MTALPRTQARRFLYLGGVIILVVAGLFAYFVLTRPPEIEAPQNFDLHAAPKEIPAFEFQDDTGATVSLETFRGRMVLLNVWATWCAPCREEMPTLDRLQAAMGGPNFEVLALSIDREGPDVVRDFFEEIGISNLSLNIDSSGRALRMLDVRGLPTTLLISREGRELGRLAGSAEWDSPEMVAFLRAHAE